MKFGLYFLITTNKTRYEEKKIGKEALKLLK